MSDDSYWFHQRYQDAAYDQFEQADLSGQDDYWAGIEQDEQEWYGIRDAEQASALTDKEREDREME